MPEMLSQELFTRRCLLPLESESAEQVAKKLSGGERPSTGAQGQEHHLVSLFEILCTNKSVVDYYQLISPAL